MKIDIDIPEVKGVYIAAIKETFPNSDASQWSVYILNNLKEDIHTLIVLSEGFSKTKKTSTLRKTITHLPEKSFAKLEILQEELFGFTNVFKVSFFKNNQLFDKTFRFLPDSINDKNSKEIPLLKAKGILAE